jgi:serine/threonine-protein kinase
MYLVSEYVDGMTLRQYVDTYRRLLPLYGAQWPTAAALCRIVHQLLDVVKWLHDQNMVHADLKLENILVTHGGDIKLVDFGLSCSVSPNASSSSIPCRAEIVGTQLYIAPERWTRAAAYDPYLGDVYALGMVVYQLINGGAAPFNTKGAIAYMATHGARTPSRYPLDGVLNTIADGLTQIDPRQRMSIQHALALLHCN